MESLRCPVKVRQGTEILTSETDSLQQQKPFWEDTFSEDTLSTAGVCWGCCYSGLGPTAAGLGVLLLRLGYGSYSSWVGVMLLRLGSGSWVDLDTSSTASPSLSNAITQREHWPSLTGGQTRVSRSLYSGRCLNMVI